ncbi:cerebellar degeneration-related protein 2-like isoform X2 [Babylonia areolata]|uniref:cerebellar degeneration-related protein 2-like isoform X2 n=1 Tax=Babylonia areolata TaxID=304850 RepID=UPI003FCFC402
MEMCETYEPEDDSSEVYCENDLELAAELGKALLERNRELEAQLHHQQHLYHEQTLKLQHVSKQLDSLRAMSESRNRVYEEMDRVSQELERQNSQLCKQAKTDRQKIERLTGTVEGLEQRVEELHKEVEEAKEADSKTRQGKKTEKRRTASLASLVSHRHDQQSFYLGDLSWTQTAEFKKVPLSPLESELLKLQETVQHLRTQCAAQRRDKEDLEVHLDVSQQENIHLQAKVKVLEDRLSEAMVLEYELEQLRQAQAQQLPVCRHCRRQVRGKEGQQAPDASLLGEVEQDEDPLLVSMARAVKLEGGECLYSSSESINKVSAEAREIQAPESKSILDELETQYKSLFHKYESLVNSKNQQSQQTDGEGESAEERALRRRLAHKEVQTLLHETLNWDFSSQDTQPPPYKVLFQDLFATLRKTRLNQEKP